MPSVAKKRVRKVQNSQNEYDLKKIECFVDGYGFVNNDHDLF